jgi:hypothetical protein
VISDQNCRTIFEHRQLTVMEPPVLLRLEQELPPLGLESCWLPHTQLQTHHRQEYHRLESHKLARNTLVHKDHILASGSSALEASTSASSALAMKA